MKKVFSFLIAVFLTTLAISQPRGTSFEEKLNKMYCTGMFQSTEGTILQIEGNSSVVGHMNILNWLPGRVAGLQVYTSRTGVSIPVIRGNIPGVYVDEMPVSLNFLNMLNVNDIAIVKIIKTPFYGGFNGGGGAIAIYTLGGEEEEE
jgi:hypothetical protein